jgi:hypothetical protein
VPEPDADTVGPRGAPAGEERVTEILRDARAVVDNLDVHRTRTAATHADPDGATDIAHLQRVQDEVREDLTGRIAAREARAAQPFLDLRLDDDGAGSGGRQSSRHLAHDVRQRPGRIDVRRSADGAARQLLSAHGPTPSHLEGLDRGLVGRERREREIDPAHDDGEGVADLVQRLRKLARRVIVAPGHQAEQNTRSGGKRAASPERIRVSCWRRCCWSRRRSRVHPRASRWEGEAT